MYETLLSFGVSACGPLRTLGAFRERSCLRLYFSTAKNAKERKDRKGKA